MIMPKFVKRHPYTCQKCKRKIQPDERTIVGGGIRKRPEMETPGFCYEVECPCCGESVCMCMSGPIPWAEVLSWVLRLGTNSHSVDLLPSLTADEIGNEQRVWLRHVDETWLFQALGGFRRSNVTYLLCRRIPLQPAGWDGRHWCGMLKITAGDIAEIITEDDPNFLPHEQWQQFQSLAEGTQIQVGGRMWAKLSSTSLRRIAAKGILKSKVKAV